MSKLFALFRREYAPATPYRRRPADAADDPFNDPAIQRMSGRELADLPWPPRD